jgi:transposase InsO family protein
MQTGFGYTAFIIDAFAGVVVGWTCSLSKHTAFVQRALRRAATNRGRNGRLDDTIHHSDTIHHPDSEYRHAGVSGFPDHRRGARQDAGAGLLSGFLTRTSD